MKTKRAARKMKPTPDEDDFPALDAWARNLKLSDGRPLNASQRREFELARSVGRPSKPESAKAKRVMISMAPSLIEAAGIYAKKTGRTLSGLIAESLAEKMKPKAS